MSGKLLFVRHGESEWNAKGVWTGITDVALTPKGEADAKKMGLLIKDIRLAHAFTSPLKRTKITLQQVLEGHGTTNLPQSHHPEITERDYGTLTGKNKWEVQKEIGETAFHGIRRGWDYEVPVGETLKDVYDRAVPFYTQEILPRLLSGENILVVGHGNTFRALMKYIEDINDKDIADVEMAFGTVVIYEISDAGKATSKEVRQAEISKTNA